MADKFNDIEITNANGESTGYIKGDGGNIKLGGNGSEGDVGLCKADGSQTIHLDGGDGNVHAGGNGSNGDLDY